MNVHPMCHTSRITVSHHDCYDWALIGTDALTKHKALGVTEEGISEGIIFSPTVKNELV